MSKKQYPSKYAPGELVTAQQYLAEHMCARRAKRDREILPERFWKIKKWAKEFVLQTVHATKLLDEFSMEAILAALRTSKGKTVFSLGLRSVLVPLIEAEQGKLNAKEIIAEAREPESESQPQPDTQPQAQAPRPQFNAGNSTLGKLRNL